MRLPSVGTIWLVTTILVSAGCGVAGPSARPEPGASPASHVHMPGEAASPESATPSSSSAPQVTTKRLRPCRYVFPLQPPGAASFGPYHHDYPATDIFAPRGTTFVAPTAGVVDWVSRVDRWNPLQNDPSTRGGLSVAIVADDGIRYYGSHLLDVAPGIEPGVRVAAGTLLGHVDSSGDARGLAPHLHFGISHPTTPGDWRVRRGEVSPYPYLNAWKAGKAETPSVPGARPPSCAGEEG